MISNGAAALQCSKGWKAILVATVAMQRQPLTGQAELEDQKVAMYPKVFATIRSCKGLISYILVMACYCIWLGKFRLYSAIEMLD